MEVFPSLLPWTVGPLTQFELLNSHVYAQGED